MSQIIPLENVLMGPTKEAPRMTPEEMADYWSFEPAMFLEWDYDQGVLTEWIRKGECNGCGDCCASLIQMRTIGGPDGRWAGLATDGRGVWAEASDGKKAYFLQTVKMEGPGSHVCPEYVEGKCRIHAVKPTICRVWPIHPAQVKAYPRCSYTFERGRAWRLKAEWTVGEEIDNSLSKIEIVDPLRHQVSVHGFLDKE